MAVTFIWPVLGKPWVTRNFWYRDPLYYGGLHAGVDIIRADTSVNGTPIVAVADGDFVAYPGLDYFSGYNGFIHHADGWRSGYRHMQRQPTSRRVRQGDVIGTVGTTGASTGPHLHFDFWHRTPQSNRVFYKLGWYAHDPEEFLGRETEDDSNMPDPIFRTPSGRMAQVGVMGRHDIGAGGHANGLIAGGAKVVDVDEVTFDAIPTVDEIIARNVK